MERTNVEGTAEIVPSRLWKTLSFECRAPFIGGLVRARERKAGN